MCPPNRLVSDELLGHLCGHVHACTALKKFRITLANWDQLDEFGSKVFDFCQMLLVSTDKLWTPPVNRQKQKSGQVEEE